MRLINAAPGHTFRRRTPGLTTGRAFRYFFQMPITLRFALCLLVWLPSSLLAQTSAWQAKFGDPEFRRRVEHADGVKNALDELAVKEKDHAALYEWLRTAAKPPQQHQIECLLLSHLARSLNRPAEEISAADDLMLQAAPGLPQGWFGRAEQYERSAQKEAAVWAVEAAVQGMRRVNLADQHWMGQLHPYRAVDWLAQAAKTDHLIEWVKAVAAALENTPSDTARPDACRLVLAILRHDAARKEPLLMQILLEAVQNSQPRLVLGDPANFVVVMRDLQNGGQPALARQVARLLVFAPVARENTDIDLQRGFNELLGMWEDTTPPYQPTTQARQILQAAMAEDAGFVEDCVRAAQDQPWNENLVTHALLSQALNGGVSAEQMALAAKLSAEARARVALRLAAFAPSGSHPHEASGPWLEELALGLTAKLKDNSERAPFESLLGCLEGLERGDENERLARVLGAMQNTAPRLDDLDHWERYAKIVLRRRNLEMTHQLAKTWGSALDQSTQQKEHLPPLSRIAVLAGKNGGVDFAMMALTLWERHHAEMISTSLPPPGIAARVGEALMACDYLEGFERFVTGLENLPNHRLTSTYTSMTMELAALRDLINGRGDHAPAVEAWIRPPVAENEAVTVQWQLVLPELGPDPESAIVITTGDRDARPPAEKLADARWWRAGTALPALARLGGTFSLEVLAGDNPEKLRSLVTIPGASARGSHTLSTLPASGCLKLMLRSQIHGMTTNSEPRFFSTRPALFVTGREPAAAEEVSSLPWPDLTQTPAPASWQPDDANRWGRMIAPPVRIEDNMEYLFTEWPEQAISPVRLILLDAEQRPLGPVPVVSTGWQAGSLSLTHTPLNRTSRVRTQRFRPSDWAGDGDLVFRSDGRAREQKPRFIAFVTRESFPRLPLLQLRPYRASTGEDRGFRSFSPDLPELNDEFIGHLGFSVHSWHVTFASDRGIITGKGALAGFDVMHIPWKPLMRAESPLIEGNEWPMVFTQEHCNIIEPPWNRTRDLGLRFVPFDTRGERYAGCRRIELPLPTYNRGEISEWLDGAVLMVSSQRGENPEPVCAWVEPDGKTHVVKLPRPPIKNRPGLEVAWWGPGGTKFTLHEDGLLFHMEHLNGLRLLGVEPGSPDDIPEGCKPGRSKRKRSWRLERPDVLVQMDKKTSMVTRRFHLPKPCEGTPMAFDSRGYVILFTTSHEIIRVHPPGRIALDD